MGSPRPKGSTMFHWIMTLQAQQDSLGVTRMQTLDGTIREADPSVRYKIILESFVKREPEFKKSVVLFYHVEPIPATA